MPIKKVVETEDEKKAREIVEGIATNIEKLASTVRGLLNGRVKKHSLVVLLASSSRLPQSQVERVLLALASMDKDHLN